MLKIVTFLLMLFAAAIPAAAQETGPVSEESLIIEKGTGAGTDSTALSLWGMIRMLLIFAAILAAIFIFFKFLKKAGRPGLPQNNMIGLVSSLVLHGNKAVHLVSIGGEYFLVGTADSGVSLISKIEDKEAIDEIRMSVSSGNAAGRKKGFLEHLASFLKPTVKKGSSGDANPETMDLTMDFMKHQTERLKKM